MNGKKARMLRKQVGNAAYADYSDTMHNKYTPMKDDGTGGTGGKRLFTTKLDSGCGRRKYQDLKQLYHLTGE